MIGNWVLIVEAHGSRTEIKSIPAVDFPLIPTSTLSYQLFTETPVSPIWIKTIRAQIKSGDELYFFEVVAKDEKGRVMYSSNLKLTIK